MKNTEDKRIEEYWTQNEASMANLNGVKTPTPEEWKSIAYETWAICLNSHGGGGTDSSAAVRTAKSHLDLLKSGFQQPAVFRKERPLLEEMIEMTDATLKKAQEFLRIHNAQENICSWRYDLETGEPVKGLAEK